MKKIIALLMVMAMVLSMAACGAKEAAPAETNAAEAPAAEAPVAEAADFKVGAIYINTQHIHIVQVQQPIGIVDHLCLTFTELDEALHLLFEAGAVVINGLLGHHASHIGSAGGVTDHSCATADQSDRLIACHLQTLHQAQSHEVADMQRICGGIKANVESGLAVVDHLTDLILIGHLCDQATGNQLIIKFHIRSSKIKSPLSCYGQRA